MESKLNLKNVNLTNGGHENVLIEGTIGELLEARFSEGTVLEIIGSKGVLRADLEVEEIRKTDKQKKGMK